MENFSAKTGYPEATVDRPLTCSNSFIKSWPGIMTLIEMTFVFLTFLCAVIPYSAAGSWFMLVTSFAGFFFILGRLVIYSRDMPSKAQDFPWMMTQIIVYTVLTLLYFIAGMVYFMHANLCDTKTHQCFTYDASMSSGTNGWVVSAAYLAFVTSGLFLGHAIIFCQARSNGAKTVEVFHCIFCANEPPAAVSPA